MSWSRVCCDKIGPPPAMARANLLPPCGACTHLKSGGLSFPSLLGKVARSAGWGVARCFDPSRIARQVTANLHRAIPAFRTPSGPPGHLPRSAEKGDAPDAFRLDDLCECRGPQGGRGRKRFPRSTAHSRVLTGIAALSLAGSLAGCFQPLYGEAAHPGLVEDMRAIEVAPIPNRVGHFLAEDLIADINGTGQTASPPKYRLVVTISLGTQTPTVNSEINVATSATLTGDANYTLIKVDGGKEVLKGTAIAAAAYDRTTQRYADLRAARDAEIRVARALSSVISLRLASALAAKSS